MARESYLSEEEQETLRKPIYQHAEAIQALCELALVVGLRVEDLVGPQVDHIRTLDGSSAERLARALTKATALLIPISPVEDVEVASENTETTGHTQEEKAVHESSDVIIVDEPTPVEVDQEAAGPLPASALRWLTGLVDDDPASLTCDDIPQIVKTVLGQRESTIAHKLDYGKIIAEFLSGLSVKDIASQNSSTPVSISATLNRLKNEISAKRGHNAPEQQETSPEVAPSVPVAVEESISPIPLIVEQHQTHVEPVDQKPLSPAESANILRNAIERPSLVTPDEWRRVAYAQLYETASQSTELTRSQVDALWSRIHFNDKDTHLDDLTEDGQVAMDCLSQHFAVKRARLNPSPYQTKALHILVLGRDKGSTLEEAFVRMHQMDSSLTRNVAQRHVVAGVMELLRTDG